MPLLGVKTNVSIKDDAKLLDLLTDAIANGTGKPKGYVSVILEGDKVMAFGGTTEPCAMICLGKIFGLLNVFHVFMVRYLLRVPHSMEPPSNRDLCFFTLFIESIGAIEGKQKDMSKAVMTILKDHLGVSPDRSYMMFNDLERKNVGYNLSTFG